jgi:hypothetical protein
MASRKRSRNVSGGSGASCLFIVDLAFLYC